MAALSKAKQLKKKKKLLDKVCGYSKCDNLFTPHNRWHKCCHWKCSIEYTKEEKAKKEKKKAALDLKEFNQNDKSYMRDQAQAAVNRYINARDKNKPCISCLKPAGFKQEAGHYRSRGNNAAIRYNTLNIHSQCHKCNCRMSGNLIPYKTNLIIMIGLAKVEWLESQTQTRDYSIEYLHRITDIFKRKLKRITA